MRPESFKARLLGGEDSVFIGRKGRKPGEFIAYRFRPNGEGLSITFLRKDGQAETYDPRKTRVLIVGPHHKFEPPTRESPVSKRVFPEGDWKSKTYELTG